MVSQMLSGHDMVCMLADLCTCGWPVLFCHVFCKIWINCDAAIRLTQLVLDWREIYGNIFWKCNCLSAPVKPYQVPEHVPHWQGHFLSHNCGRWVDILSCARTFCLSNHGSIIQLPSLVLTHAVKLLELKFHHTECILTVSIVEGAAVFSASRHQCSYCQHDSLYIDRYHYCDVIKVRWRIKSPASWLFTQPFIQTQIKVNIQAPRHWPLCADPTQMASNVENVSIWWRHHAVKYRT